MQINTNNLEQQGTNIQQLRFVPISSNVSCMGTTVNYGIGTHSGAGINAFSNNSQPMTGWAISPQVGYVNASQITNTTPCISASQFGQMGSGTFNGITYNTQIPMGRNLMIQPTVDISETSSDIMVSAYVSNSAINDLKLNVTDDSLTISGTLLNGSNQFVLNRTIPLSTSVRAEAVEATLQSGVVEIRLPKTEKFNRASHTLGKDTGNVMISK
ncbi:Hsp20/alpha crystallin family protein [Clostridium kluyveri]|uniref:Heat-shock protein n=1 Tax=Clostridium kluyveri TaxID=1534 RepID=A0A1L5F6H6_CLOKL|nr:Hsp20/alpha crystallin family protein [Clostridium kluyveri]APM38440.1 heat-shock protein [Clostridium kluyveri]UZQ50724.1 Hsp20/alpha crystallin family protein [Clostridium kluyveri]